MYDENFNRPDDHEAKMARADLYKLANYSMKLFKMINEGDELEGWVQAKITKAADYIASVYHFMEYEMKTSEYGDALENAEMYSESVRRAFEQKLMEAKACKAKMSAKAKKELAVEEGIEDKLEAAREKAAAKGKTKEKEEETSKSNTRKVAGKAYGGSKQKSDQEVNEAKKKLDPNAPFNYDDWAKSGEKPKAPRGLGGAVKEPGKIRAPAKFSDKVGGDRAKLAAKYDESAKPDFLDVDKDGDKKEPMKKAVKDSKVKKEDINKSDVPAYKRKASGAKDWKVSQADLDKEANNPKHISSKAGLAKRKQELGMDDITQESTGDYSAKKGAAGKDLGKPGKNFEKIAKSAGEKYGSKERGEKVAGAVLKKLRAKESIESLKKKLTESTSLVEFAMDTIKHPKYGRIEWLNHGGAHMIATKDPVTGSLKIHAMGSQEEIAKKWAKIKASISNKVAGVVESVLNTVLATI